MSYSFFVTAAKGTEPALRDELRALRVPDVRADRGGVHFGGSLKDAYRVCMWSRVGIRVLQKIAEFDCDSDAALYAGARDVAWTDTLDASRTVSVSAVARDSRLTHTNFIAQRVKDAIVDHVRDKSGARPDVDRDDADVQVFAHVVKDRGTLYLDMGGTSLHRRGYRAESRGAPLRENLAAAMVLLSGWDWDLPLCDPMCGSGTIAIEAAMMASGVAPHLHHERFGFERWLSYDDAAKSQMADVRADAKDRAATNKRTPQIFAADNDASAVALTRKNAAKAGVTISTEVQSVFELGPSDPPGFVVTNPPYGVRISGGEYFEEELADLFLGLHGHRITVICATPDLEDAMRLRPVRRQPLFNGDIECRLYNWVIP